MELEVTRNLEDVEKYVSQFCEVVDGTPKKECLSVLFALVTEMTIFMKQIREFTTSEKEDALERMVLEWLKTADTVAPFHFSKYIKKNLL